MNVFSMSKTNNASQMEFKVCQSIRSVRYVNLRGHLFSSSLKGLICILPVFNSTMFIHHLCVTKTALQLKVPIMYSNQCSSTGMTHQIPDDSTSSAKLVQKKLGITELQFKELRMFHTARYPLTLQSILVSRPIWTSSVIYSMRSH